MKKIIAVSIVAFIAISCKKETLQNSREDIAGKWELIKTVGTWSSGIPLPAGNGNIIILNSHGSFERRRHDTVLYRGNYNLQKRKDCYSDEKKLFIETSDNSLSFEINHISQRNDTLYISTTTCYSDGQTTLYRKL